MNMSREIIGYLKLFHGTYNTIIMILIVYQGMLGMKIRKSKATPVNIIKRHRKIGPIAVMLGIAGFFAGLTITFLDFGRIFKFPLHFITGLIIVFALIMTYFISEKIKGPDKLWRNRHYAFGILIIVLYVLQVILGISILW
jgi:cytochrome b561